MSLWRIASVFMHMNKSESNSYFMTFGSRSYLDGMQRTQPRPKSFNYELKKLPQSIPTLLRMQFLSFHFAIPKDVKNWKSCVCFYVVLELRIWKRKFFFLEFFFYLMTNQVKANPIKRFPRLEFVPRFCFILIGSLDCLQKVFIVQIGYKSIEVLSFIRPSICNFCLTLLFNLKHCYGLRKTHLLCAVGQRAVNTYNKTEQLLNSYPPIMHFYKLCDWFTESWLPRKTDGNATKKMGNAISTKYERTSQLRKLSKREKALTFNKSD